MNLEQRVEALEQAVKFLAGGEFTIKDGQVFINNAFIQDGKIRAASLAAANYGVNLGINYCR